MEVFETFSVIAIFCRQNRNRITLALLADLLTGIIVPAWPCSVVSFEERSQEAV